MPSLELSQSAYDELKALFTKRCCDTVGIHAHTITKNEKGIDNWNVLEMKPKYTAQFLFKKCQKLFPCYSYYQLSKIKSDYSGEYTVTFAPNVESDEEHKNKSANDLEGVRCITLEERLLLELQYFKTTGKHLDVDNVTLCAGSRNHGGGVPTVDWNDDQLNVGGCDPVDSREDIRVRSEV